jgi:hypothetical protein
MTSTVNGEARGPEEIRAAFTTAIDTANGHAEDLTGIAGVLGEAADRYETLQMSSSTLGHLRDGAAAVRAAAAALGTAGEQLQAALTDFNDRDGQVGDAVAEAGNLMRPEGYTETFGQPTPSAHAREASMPTDTPAAGTAPTPDKLKLSARMALQAGEHVAGSDAMDAPEGIVCAVAVASPHGPRVHVGLNIGDEDKNRWRGEDKGSTLVLDPAAAQQLQQAADDMAAAEQAGRDRDRELRSNATALEKQRDRLLKKRYGDQAEAIGELLDEIDTHQFNLRLNAKHLDDFPAMLGPDDRAAYDSVDAEIAAEIAKLPLDTDLETHHVVDQRRIGELRKQQKAILAGVTPDELRTLEYLERKHPKTRTWDEEQQLQRLHNAPGGVQERSRFGDGKNIINFDGAARMIDDEVIGIARSQRSINLLRSRTAPNPDLDEPLAVADAAFQQADNELFEYRDGTRLGTGEVPAQWGSLAWSTTIDEDGRIRHDLDRRPPDAEPDWEPGGDPVRLTLAGVRKFTGLVTNLMAASQSQQPTGDQS